MSKANQKFDINNKKEDAPKITRAENEIRRTQMKAKNYNNTKKMI
jgi:hypothetical protein